MELSMNMHLSKIWGPNFLGPCDIGMVRTSNQILTRGRVSADSASQRAGLRRTRLESRGDATPAADGSA